jgi:hypothetical protein
LSSLPRNNHSWNSGTDVRSSRSAAVELKFLILRHPLSRRPEFLQIAGRWAASSDIQPAPDRLGDLTQLFKRKLVAVPV